MTPTADTTSPQQATSARLRARRSEDVLKIRAARLIPLGATTSTTPLASSAFITPRMRGSAGLRAYGTGEWDTRGTAEGPLRSRQSPHSARYSRRRTLAAPGSDEAGAAQKLRKSGISSADSARQAAQPVAANVDLAVLALSRVSLEQYSCTGFRVSRLVAIGRDASVRELPSLAVRLGGRATGSLNLDGRVVDLEGAACVLADRETDLIVACVVL